MTESITESVLFKHSCTSCYSLKTERYCQDTVISETVYRRINLCNECGLVTSVDITDPDTVMVLNLRARKAANLVQAVPSW